ncbi:hypothetical protein [Kitasatospora purpeofusca]|uniref:Uncharacterized protein n=1 Tax=Kitasatospora purpeofusca TaxID=67352 RepID=A0ABZ1TV33_9ACTN|nr:hypothetical protein [Kitasatospora purpeofusca]
MISAQDFTLLSHWTAADRIAADVEDPDGTAARRLAEVGHLVPGYVPGCWRLTPAGHAARAEYTRAHPVGPRH